MKHLLLIFLLAATQAYGAMSGTNRGSGTHNTSATTFTLSPSGNFAAGSMAVLIVSADNSCSGGGACATFTATDTLSNTWTRQQYPLNDVSNASVGVQGGIFTTQMNGGTLTTGTTITITFTTATTAKTWTLIEVSTNVKGNIVQYVTGGTGTGGTTTTSPTITTGSISAGDMVVAAVFVEAGTTDTVTAEADTVNGSWSTQQTNKIGTTATGNEVASQFKVVTAAGAQTYNPTLALSSEDSAIAWIELSQVSKGGFLSFFTP